MILTFFLMQPVGAVIYDTAILPLENGKMTPLDALQVAGTPMRAFMAHYVRDKDVALFLDLAKEPRPHKVEDLSFRVLLPSYILSELKAGFQIGTVLFLPFLVVDMVVASITTSVGMMQLPTGRHLDATEAVVVPDGRWMASADYLTDEELSIMGTDAVVSLGRMMLEEVMPSHRTDSCLSQSASVSS